MKIDRRSFLALGMGTSVGITLSPLPWKLTDDISIWTQNWPWTPVPQDGEALYENTICRLCPAGCGITVRKIGDRAVKIEGMDGHPVNDGGICILGLSGLQLLYGPTRIKTPLKRTGKRGEGQFKSISWNEALSEIAAKLDGIRSSKGGDTLACISGTEHGTTARLFKRFLDAYGSPNFIVPPSMTDVYEMAATYMHGETTPLGFDVDNSDFLLSFGAGLLDGWGSRVAVFRANSSVKHGKGKVIQIEPRLSNTAANADQWVPIEPGTETALALGIAHVIIKENLYNKEFIEQHTHGFDGFKRFVLNNYNPKRVEKTTGVSPSKIKSMAKAFSQASRPLAITGQGNGATPGSIGQYIAVHALNALAGSINREGGVVTLPQLSPAEWPEIIHDAIAMTGIQRQRIDGGGGHKYPKSRNLMQRFMKIIKASMPSPVQALFVHEANPLFSLPDTHLVEQALSKIPFIVSFSSFMDETAANADLVLPNHMYLERFEDVPLAMGFATPIQSLVRPVVKPQFDTKNSGDVIIQLAKAMGGEIAGAFPWDSYEACLEEALGDQWDTLNESIFVVDENFKPSDGNNTYKTPSGKFEFTNEHLQENPWYATVTPIGNKGSYPLILMPYDIMRLSTGYIGTPPFVMKTVADTILKGNTVFVEINPQTAHHLNLREGSVATLSTPKGSARVKVHLYEGVSPGVIAFPRGLGHTAYDDYLAGKGVNFNALMGSIEDPITGHDAAWGIRANLKRMGIS